MYKQSSRKLSINESIAPQEPSLVDERSVLEEVLEKTRYGLARRTDILAREQQDSRFPRAR